MVRRGFSSLVAFLCFLSGMGAMGVVAATVHVFGSGFGGVGPGSAGVGVDGVSHDVFVGDPANARVDEFSSGGVFVRAWGWGGADGMPSFESCTLSCQAGIPGSGVGQFVDPSLVAVDNSAGASQ